MRSADKSFRSFFLHGSTRTDRTSQLVKLNSDGLHWTFRHFHLICTCTCLYIYIYTQQTHTHTKSTYARQGSRPRNGDPGDTPSQGQRTFRRFVEHLHLDKRMEFSEGDVGIAGGIQILEAANVHPTYEDSIHRNLDLKKLGGSEWTWKFGIDIDFWCLTLQRDSVMSWYEWRWFVAPSLLDLYWILGSLTKIHYQIKYTQDHEQSM